jgi:hypothetical protein
VSGFSVLWLDLREPADRRARSGALMQALARHLEGRDVVRVIDLGCGSGSNLRATAPALGPQQTWMLVDNDTALLDSARARLCAWAERAEATPEGVRLIAQGKDIAVRFVCADLAHDLESLLSEDQAADVVTASALFDLCSSAFVERSMSAIAKRQSAFYTALTFDGSQTWTPAHPADQRMLDAFSAHQQTDKGFGVALGPKAPAALRETLQGHGYRVAEASTPWQLGASDQPLIHALSTGFADAVAETGWVDRDTLADWRRLQRTGATVGHIDTLALPVG